MKNLFTSRQLAIQWQCHRTSVLRICRRYGYSGYKFGPRASARRFEKSEIEQIERAAAAGGTPLRRGDKPEAA